MPSLDIKGDKEVVTIRKSEMASLLKAEQVLRALHRCDPCDQTAKALNAIGAIINVYKDKPDADVPGAKGSESVVDDAPKGKRDSE